MILRNVRNNDTQMLSEYKNVAKTCFSPTLNVLPIFLLWTYYLIILLIPTQTLPISNMPFQLNTQNPLENSKKRQFCFYWVDPG